MTRLEKKKSKKVNVKLSVASHLTDILKNANGDQGHEVISEKANETCHVLKPGPSSTEPAAFPADGASLGHAQHLAHTRFGVYRMKRAHFKMFYQKVM